MFASQISPGCGFVIESLVAGGIAVQEGAVVSDTRKPPLPAFVLQPRGELNQVLVRQFFNGLFEFQDISHGYNLQQALKAIKLRKDGFGRLETLWCPGANAKAIPHQR